MLNYLLFFTIFFFNLSESIICPQSAQVPGLNYQWYSIKIVAPEVFFRDSENLKKME